MKVKSEQNLLFSERRILTPCGYEKPEYADILSHVLEVVDLAFYRGFADWSVMFFGDSIKHITGYDREEFLAGDKKWIDVILPEDKQKASTILKEAIKHRKSHYLRTYRIVTTSGLIKWVSDRGKIVYNENGKFVHMDGLIIDVTKEKTLENIIERAKKDWELVFDSIPNLVVMADVESGSCVLRRVNKAFASRLGYHPRDVVNKTCKSLLSAGGSFHDCLKEFESERLIIEKEAELPVLNGYFHVTHVPVMDSNRRIEKVICIFTDITKLKEAKDHLAALSRELAFVIDSVSALVIGIDEQGRIYRWNRVAETVFDKPASEVIGRTFTDLAFPGDFETRVIPAVQECFETKRRVQLSEARVYVEGATRVLDLLVKPFFTRENHCRVFVTGFDVTERKNLEMMLVHAQKLEAIGSLAAGIAHEINTPCQCMLSNLTFLKDEISVLLELAQTYENIRESIRSRCPGLDEVWIRKIDDLGDEVDVPFLLEEIPQSLNQALECLNRVIRIVGSIKEFSHPGAQEKSIVDIHRLIRSTVDISRNEWKYVADIEFDFDSELPPITCYPSELSQVILNLIVNAAQAIKELLGDRPEVKGRITIRTRRRESWCEISVSDTGGGIPKGIQHKVFEPFFTTKPPGKGTGQGLSIAQSIIMKKHNGHIYFETEEGKGTTFFVLIPMEEMTGF